MLGCPPPGMKSDVGVVMVMEQTVTRRLHELRPGEKAVVVGFDEASGDYIRRLMTLGLTPGASLSFLRSAPLGDPLEVLVRGTRLCLRRNEADCLRLAPLAE